MRKCLLWCAALASFSAQAAVMQWTAVLTPGQETGTVFLTNPAGEVFNPSGSGTVMYDTDTNVLSANLMWAGLTGPGMASHIHCCAASVNANAPIAVDLWLSDNPQPATGMFSRSWDLDSEDPFRNQFLPGQTVFQKLDVLIAAMNRTAGVAYFNIHTQLNPPGEIRGNIAPVPEPGTWLIMASGLGALVLRRRMGA